jgi:hypothetical protein
MCVKISYGPLYNGIFQFFPFMFLCFQKTSLWHRVRFAGSRRVLATTVDDWLENLLALAPVQACTYVEYYHNL